MLLGACLLSLIATSGAYAQQITGTPGAPSATTTVDGNYLPNPPPAFGGAKVIERLERLGDRLAGIERGEDVAIPVLLGLEVSRELRTERLVGTDQRAIVEDNSVQLDLQQRGISQRPILLLDELRQELVEVRIQIAPAVEDDSMSIDAPLARGDSRRVEPTHRVAAHHVREDVLILQRPHAAGSVRDSQRLRECDNRTRGLVLHEDEKWLEPQDQRRRAAEERRRERVEFRIRGRQQADAVEAADLDGQRHEVV